MRSNALLLIPMVLAALLASTVVVVAASEPAQAAFPGKNGKIAFVGKPKDGRAVGQIFTINPNGSGKTQLTKNRNGSYDPAWSPRGKKLLLVRYTGGGSTSEIYMMNRDGSKVKRLTRNSEPDYNPSWSPDGTEIVFSSSQNGESGIFVMNRDGSGVRRLTDQPGDEPSWSPDGTKVAFVSAGNDLMIVDAGGFGEPTTLVRSEEVHNPDFMDGVDWSPDGQRIAFSTYIIDRGRCCKDLYTVRADGTGLTVLVDGGAWPAWSPNGSKIAFTKDGRIYVMNADRTGRRAEIAIGGGSLSWQPL